MRCNSYGALSRLWMVAILASSSCSHPAAQPQVTAEAPLVEAPAEPPPYRVMVGDVLAVRLFLTPELNEDVTVRPDGRISTTLAEGISAAGQTPEDIGHVLLAAYDKELKDPRLTVEVKTPAPTRIYVAGEVPSPGEMETTGPGLTLLQAVARAGGLRPTGDPDRIVIVRHGEDNRPILLATHYLQAVNGANPEADVHLAPFDVVYVPKTGIARIYVWVNQHIQQFVPVSWGFSYNVTPVVNNQR